MAVNMARVEKLINLDWIELKQRIFRKTIEMATIFNYDSTNPPPNPLALFHDKVTNQRFLTCAVTCGFALGMQSSFFRLEPEMSAIEFAEWLSKNCPDMPLLCDREIIDEITRDSVVLKEEEFRGSKKLVIWRRGSPTDVKAYFIPL